MVEPQAVQFIELVLRVASALTLTVAAGVTIAMLLRHRLRPGYIWAYLAIVVTIIAVWRWVVVALIYPEVLPDQFPSLIAPWVQPINQLLYTLAGIAVTLVVVASSRVRRV